MNASLTVTSENPACSIMPTSSSPAPIVSTRLAACIREVLQAAISQGGTTLRDFLREDDSPGYFAMSLNVYGRAGHPCPACGAAIACKRIGQRSTFFCPRCQR